MSSAEDESAKVGQPSASGRKPPGISWETWVDKQISEAMERGEFDGLPGHGKPLADIDRPRDEMWWIRAKLRSENVGYTPPAMSLRVEVDETRERIAIAKTEEEVRALVSAINERIRYVNSHTISGPPTSIGVLDIDNILQRWREAVSDD